MFRPYEENVKIFVVGPSLLTKQKFKYKKSGKVFVYHTLLASNIKLNSTILQQFTVQEAEN